jgi:hypothetical protein
LVLFLGVRGDVRAQAQVGTQNQVQPKAQAQPQGKEQPQVQVNLPPSTDSRAAVPAGAHVIDGVAARIEDDIIMESEVRELSAFQQLVDGKSKPRSDVIRELADQWILRGEAKTALFATPSQQDVDRSYAQFVKQFASPEDFKARCMAADLTDAAVRRMIEQQLYLSRFLDYRFRPEAQVDRQQIETYYRDEFVPQLKARNQAVPSVDDVADTIREVLIQRAINDNATKWLDDTRGRLRIDIVQEGNGS